MSISTLVRNMIPTKSLSFDEAFARLRAYVTECAERKQRIQDLQTKLDQLMHDRAEAITEGEDSAIRDVSTIETELNLLRRAETLSHGRAREAAAVVGTRAGELERECRLLLRDNQDAAKARVWEAVSPWYDAGLRENVISMATLVQESCNAVNNCPSAVGITPAGEHLHPDIAPAAVLGAYERLVAVLEGAKQNARRFAVG